jgi:hypothetical protein
MEDEKKCKYCAMMIPAAAKICPHCRKDQGIPTGIGCLIVAIMTIVIVVIFSMAGTNNTGNSINNTEPAISLTKSAIKIKKNHPDWPNDICNIIGDKKISIGMTSTQVKAAWGRPYKINTTDTAYGTREQWVMSDSYNSSYLYFDNGILKSIQQSR